MIKLTENRKAVHETLRKSTIPIDASTIVDLLKLNMDQATVYRSLHYLEKSGLIHSFVYKCNKNGEKRYYSINDSEHHCHYFHCEKCHTFMEINECKISHLKSLEKKYGISIRSHTIHYTGTCESCKS